MEQKKLQMNNGKFIKIWAVVLAVLLVLEIGVTYAMNFFSVTMETQLGRGERITTVPENMANSDTDFYDTEVANLDEITDAAALAIAEEGIVLMKNDGVLPLEKGSNVTPFGYRYISPVYGGGGSGNVNTASPRIVTAIGALNKYFAVNSDMQTVLDGATAWGLSPDGYENPDESNGFLGASYDIIEFDPAIYAGHEAAAAGTTGIVFLGRIGGEGGDIQTK